MFGLLAAFGRLARPAPPPAPAPPERYDGKSWNDRRQHLLIELRNAAQRRAPPAVLAGIVAEMSELTQRIRRCYARSFDAEAKRACLDYHYGWALRTLGPSGLAKLIEAPVELWAAETEGVRRRVDVRAEQWVGREGEVSLDMYAGDVLLCTLSFTLTPAGLFGPLTSAAVLVSRIQGRPGAFEETRLATKALSEVAPRAVLFAALAGLCRVWGVRYVYGVAAVNFLYCAEDTREALERQYDAFFVGLDAEGPKDGFFVVDTLAPPKPVTAQKTGHRVRTRKKRQLKAQIALAVAKAWIAEFEPGRVLPEMGETDETS